jgi:hypothetical protein
MISCVSAKDPARFCKLFHYSVYVCEENAQLQLEIFHLSCPNTVSVFPSIAIDHFLIPVDWAPPLRDRFA